MRKKTNNIKNNSLNPSSAIFGILFIVTVLSFAISTNITVSADTSVDDTVTITVDSTCTLSGVVPSGSEHTATITPGQNVPNIGTTNMTAICNDAAGYDIYAVGYSNDEWKNTNLISEQTVGSTTTTYTIPTGTATSGNNSNWSMKLATGTGDAATIVTSPTDYSAFANVPSDYTKVAYYPSSTTGSSGSSFTTTYQVFSSTSQTAGTYTGKVKYTLVHPNNAPAPEVPIYMQDFTTAQCQAQATDAPLTVYDKRDGSDYTVRYINGACWMTQNLRITGTISAADSNFSGSDFNVSEYSLDSSDSSYAGHCNASNTYNYACSKDSGDKTIGAWYSYVAASAGTIVGNNNETLATEDICPANWHLPSYDDTNSSPGSINSLLVSTAYKDLFSPATGGYYFNGSVSQPDYGYWWSTTASSAYGRHTLYYYSNNLTSNGLTRYYGYNVRCTR